MAVMDRGRLLCTGTPEEVGGALKGAATRRLVDAHGDARVGGGGERGIPPRYGTEGRTGSQVWRPHDRWSLCPRSGGGGYLRARPSRRRTCGSNTKRSCPMVKGLSLRVGKGEFWTLGGNGTGKTTSPRCWAGLHTPYRGSVRLHGAWGCYLNPQALFVKKTVREDLFRSEGPAHGAGGPDGQGGMGGAAVPPEELLTATLRPVRRRAAAAALANGAVGP
ncbi:MAG: hypothetical protein ACLSAF_21995 [Intestinimonas sp.]